MKPIILIGGAPTTGKSTIAALVAKHLNLQPKEIAWVLNFSHKLKAEAKQYGYPSVEVKKQYDDLPAVLSALGLESVK